MKRRQKVPRREWLREIRRKSGRSVPEIAEAAGISINTYYHVEDGTDYGSRDTLMGIAEALGFPMYMWEPRPAEMQRHGPRPIGYAAEARHGGRAWLLRIRVERGMTHREVARLASVAPNYYSLIELGVQRGSETVRENIAMALGFPYHMWEVNG